MERRSGGAQRIPRPVTWAPGDPAPPVPYPLAVDVDAVVRRVDGVRPARPLAPTFPDARPSAVLVALADGPDGAEVLLTRRSRHLRNHKGEISFPGGRMDPGETPIDTAIREADEEVGLDPAEVVVVGELSHLSTVVSRSYIVPIVARLPDRLQLAPASPEVERVLWVPLSELVRADTYRAERWGRRPTDRELYFFELDDETVWGATAAMLVDLLRRLA